MGSYRKYKLIQACIVVLPICKNEDDRFKIKSTRVVTIDLTLYVYGNFSSCSRAAYSTVQGLISPNFESIQDFMVVLVTCKNEEDPIKNVGARVVTTLSINFKMLKGS